MLDSLSLTKNFRGNKRLKCTSVKIVITVYFVFIILKQISRVHIFVYHTNDAAKLCSKNKSIIGQNFVGPVYVDDL